MLIIELDNVSKAYKYPVLKNINYGFNKGKTYLVVGENGSGKSTLIKLILSLINPSRGIIKKQTKNISYVPDNLSFPEFLRINKFLYNLGLIYKIQPNILNEKIKYYLNKYLIDGNYKLNELSKGMRQKVLIIQSLLKDGDVYIFDEPLNGLDKDIQEIFFQEIIDLKERNKTIIIITHQLAGFDLIYDYILQIKDGMIHEEFS